MPSARIEQHRQPPARDAGGEVVAWAASGPGWRRFAPWLAGLLTLLAVVLVALHFAQLAEFAKLARAARPSWLVLACLTQAATYLTAALAWRQALRRAGHPRRLRTLVPLGVAKLFTDQVVPSSGVSGAILVTRALVRRRVPTPVAMAVLLVGLVSYFAAYAVSALAGIAILWLHDRATAAFLAAVALLIALLAAIPTGVLWLKRWAHRLPAIWVSRLPGTAVLLRSVADAPTTLLRDPALLVQTIGLEVAVFALDSLTLWLAFRALGVDPPLWVAFVGFMAASMAATLGPIPLGLGTFEGACVGMLTLLGVAVEAALAATLLLRGLTFWAPMLPGLWLARRELAA